MIDNVLGKFIINESYQNKFFSNYVEFLWKYEMIQKLVIIWSWCSYKTNLLAILFYFKDILLGLWKIVIIY